MRPKEMFILIGVIHMAPVLASKSPIAAWLFGMFFIVLSRFEE